MSTVYISCEIFNGSEPLTTTIYKDGTFLIEGTNPLLITNPDFGIYTVVVSSENCGAAQAVSRILQEG